MSDQPTVPSQTLAATFETLTRRHVDAWIATRRIEDLTLDFKRARECFEVPDERKALAKAISGFANASGGLIVWGVRATRDADGIDAAQDVEPIRNPAKFLSNLTSYSGSAVSPAFPAVVHRLIDDSSVALTLVPESDAGPYMANLGLGCYYTRAGSSFLQMEHFQVVDAFNRRRRPDLRVYGRLPTSTDELVVGLHNIGRVSAKAPYLEVQASGPWMMQSTPMNNLPVLARDGAFNPKIPRFGGSLTTVVHPQMHFDVCVFVWRGARDSRKATIELEFAFAAEDVPLTRGTLSIPWETGAHATS